MKTEEDGRGESRRGQDRIVGNKKEEVRVEEMNINLNRKRRRQMQRGQDRRQQDR